MKITFLGTRGNIEARTRRHYRHTVTVVSYKGTTVMIDCGADWRGKFEKYIRPNAIILTHAHPDHADGLKDGAPCPVYATRASWQLIKRFPIQEQRTITHKPFSIGRIKLQAFFVRHSVRAPAVGYRITAGKATIFCVHDLLAIPHQHAALKKVKLYIGDGASLTRPIMRYVEGTPSGHAPIKKQIAWCAQEGVPRAIFTHCGSQIVKGNTRALNKKLQLIGEEYGVEVGFAYDGMTIILR